MNINDLVTHYVAFRRTLGRRPSEAEIRISRDFISSADPESAESWSQLQQTLFACVDFRYID